MNDAASQVNPRKLFVGNVAYSVTEEALSQYFGQFGTLVSVKLIMDRATGRSKGIAFVEYETEEMAQAAIEAANGADLDGRALVVNVARPQVPREQRSYSNNQGGYNNNRGGYDSRSSY